MRIGVLTGGGDCPGLNAVISSLVKSGIREGMEFIGFKKGFNGLLGSMDYLRLEYDTVRSIAHTGGTILKTSNKGPFASKVGSGQLHAIEPDIIREVKHNLASLSIDCLVVIGGDGSLSTALQLQNAGINIVGVPKTIDNDLLSTDQTFGFSSAVEVISESLSRIHTTAVSHDRVFVIETMGRNAGWLTLYGGLAGGAHIILIPEIPFHYDSILAFLNGRKQQEKSYAIIAVAEGATPDGGVIAVKKERTGGEHVYGGIADEIISNLERRSPGMFEFRSMVLGHLQRGGEPNAVDRILSQRFGYLAMKAIKAEAFGKMVTFKGNQAYFVPIADAVSRLKHVDPNSDIIQMARSTGVSFGDPSSA